jgi:MFS family permease
MLLASLGISIANVGLPALAQAFGASFAAVQWVVLAYLLAVTALVVSVGRLGDLVGRRRLLLAGLALFTAASALCGVAPSLGLLVAARALQGLGAAALMALTLAFVGTAVPRSQAGRAMGLLGATSAVGTALGPALGGMLLSAFGWRALFLAPVPAGILALALAYRHLPPDPAPKEAVGARPDVPGTLLLALVLAAYALAMTWARGRSGATAAALLLAAALGAGLLLRVERRAASPLVPLAMLRDPALGAALAANALVSTVMMATLVVGPFHLAHALGLDAARVGLALSAGPIVAALGGVPAGHLVDRFGARRTTAAGLACMAAGASLLAMLPATLGVAGYVAPLVAVTAGYALFQAANNTSVLADVDAARRGLVSGLLTLSRNLGLVTGASAMGAVFAAAAGGADLVAAPPEAVAAGTRATYAVAALLVVLALALVRAGRVLASRLRPDPSGS